MQGHLNVKSLFICAQISTRKINKQQIHERPLVLTAEQQFWWRCLRAVYWEFHIAGVRERGEIGECRWLAHPPTVTCFLFYIVVATANKRRCFFFLCSSEDSQELSLFKQLVWSSFLQKLWSETRESEYWTSIVRVEFSLFGRFS